MLYMCMVNKSKIHEIYTEKMKSIYYSSDKMARLKKLWKDLITWTSFLKLHRNKTPVSNYSIELKVMNISENESSVFFIICTFCENYTETITCKHLPVYKIACNHAKELIGSRCMNECLINWIFLFALIEYKRQI